MAQQKYAYHSTDHTGIVVNWRITCLALQPGLGLFPRRRTAPVNHSDTGFHASIAACAIWKRGTWFPHARDAWEARSSDPYRLLGNHSHHGQWKTQSQFVLKVDLDMVQSKLLELHPAKVMNICGVAFHFL